MSEKTELSPRLTRSVSLALHRSGLIRAWALVPRPIRRRIARRLLGNPFAGRAPGPGRAVPPFVFVGEAGSGTGFGWALRASAEHLVAAGHDVRVVDVTDYVGHGRVAGPAAIAPADVPTGPGTLVLFCNPPQLAYLGSLLPRRALDGKHVVASCAWELERIPTAWRLPLGGVDEVWVPSAFVRDAFLAGSDRPVTVVPYPIEPPPGLKADRAAFRIPADRFVVLVAANLRSGLARKNLTGAIDAFRLAFGDRGNELLVVKVSDGRKNASALAAIQAAIGGAPNIVVLDRSLGDHEMWQLVAASDAVLSLHRSEGYGIVLKQGLLLGKHVIATGWSGNVDFMEGSLAHPVAYDLVSVSDPGGVFAAEIAQRWAEPRIADAARLLRACRAGGAGLTAVRQQRAGAAP